MILCTVRCIAWQIISFDKTSPDELVVKALLDVNTLKYGSDDFASIQNVDMDVTVTCSCMKVVILNKYFMELKVRETDT